ncbi:MAG: MCE family protein [Candidatus Thiodiazotropha sp. (ex Monitilora ramsayi)]|nr:MCE family protein [Candidatus Thiodiazotropha sp. (ex Monitilora ramsayi)]
MSDQGKVNPGLIGAFVLGAMLLGLGAIFYLSSNGFSAQERNYFILYFESDIKGLQIGSPVNFRGVKIGQVESMHIAYDSQNREFRIPVIISISSGKVVFDGVERESEGLFNLDEMIQRGFRARLNLQSLVTGKLEVELSFEPKTEIRLIGRKDEKYPEIPTIQSNMEKIASAIEELPLKRITRRVSEILDSVDKVLAKGEIPKMINTFVLMTERLESITRQLESETPKLLTSTHETVDETRVLIRELTGAAKETRLLIQSSEKKLDAAFSSWDATLASGEATFDQVRQVAASADSVIRQDSPLVNEMSAALRELGAAARSIRVMSEYLERHPEALLRGKQ